MLKKLCSASLLNLFVFFLSTGYLCAQKTNDSFTVMFYNVCNLFDTKHLEQEKNDWEFLPLNYPGKKEHCKNQSTPSYIKKCLNTDWIEQKLEIKINQITKVVKSSGTTLPNFLGLAEIENKDVLTRLANKLGYNEVLITNSPDKRGIDVGLLFNLPPSISFVTQKEHKITGRYFTSNPTRNILEAEFNINNGEKLFIFVNHWPSQNASSDIRIQVGNQLHQIINQRKLQFPNSNIILLGDFNVIATESPNPLQETLLKNNFVIDSYDLLLKSSPLSQKYKIAPGTHFYPPSFLWDRLDRIFINQNLANNSGTEIIKNSFKIYTPSFITKDYHYDKYPNDYLYGSIVKKTPYYYNFNAITEKNAGFSDHFPVIAKFIIIK